MSWNAAYEGVPDGRDSPSTLGSTARDLKTSIEGRMENEHDTYVADGTAGAEAKDWRHKEGSARAYYQSVAPTNQPGSNGAALGADDEGRIFIDSDDDALKVWNGTSFDPVRCLDLQNPSGDADVQQDFASDASFLWDESEDEFYLNKGLKIDGGIETSGTKIKTKVMSASKAASGTVVTVTHGMNYLKIRGIAIAFPYSGTVAVTQFALTPTYIHGYIGNEVAGTMYFTISYID